MTDVTAPPPKPAIPPKRRHPGPWLLIEKFHDQTTFAVCYIEAGVDEKRRGGKRIEISDADAQLAIVVLERLYGEQAAVSKQTTPEFLNRLINIAKNSNFEGERLNAASLYQRVTGKPCPQ
jgi:hypothetical protein